MSYLLEETAEGGCPEKAEIHSEESKGRWLLIFVIIFIVLFNLKNDIHVKQHTCISLIKNKS